MEQRSAFATIPQPTPDPLLKNLKDLDPTHIPHFILDNADGKPIYIVEWALSSAL